MKKSTRLAILLCCVVVLACSLALVACHKDEQGYKVSVNYDSSMGNVTLSQPNEGKLYDAGEQVTVTVTPNSGYVVQGFQVSGHLDAKLNGNSYTFSVAEDTIVTVVFGEASGDKTYTITLYCDEGATAYVSAEQVVGNVFAAGTTVTLHVTPNDGYRIYGVLVDNKSVDLDAKGEYSFVLNSNVSIDVYVNRDFGDSSYKLLQGNVRFDGIMTEVRMVGETDIIYLSNIIKVYDPEQNAVQSSEYIYNQLTGQTDILNFAVMQGDDEGYLNVVYHDLQGKVHRERAVENGMYVQYSNVQNPFEVLNKDDFYFDETDGSWQMVDQTLMGALVYQLTGYLEDVESVRLYDVNDGVHVEIVSNIMAMTDDNGNSYYTIHSFDLIATGTNAVVDPDLLKDYPLDDSHEQLVLALTKAQQATSYRVTHEEVGSLEGAFVTFRTDKAIWSSGTDIAEGYVARPDGSAWLIELNAQGKAVITGTSAYASSLDRICASFDLGEISPSMFVKGNDGVYRLRDADVAFYGSSLAVSLASAFTTGSMEKNFATLADNLSLVVRNGELAQVRYVWSGYDMDYSRMAGVATLNFDQYNTATLPITLDETAVNGIVDKALHGSWFTSDGSLRLDVSFDYVLLDGDECESLAKNSNGSYTFKRNGVSYTMSLNGEGKLTLAYSGKTLTLERRVCDWNEFIGSYHGESGAGSYHNSLTVVIEKDKITVKLVNINTSIDGMSFVFDLNVNDEAFVFTESVNGASEFAMFDGNDIYYLTQVDRNGNVWLFSNYGVDISMYLYRDDMGADLSVFIAGTYRDDDDNYVVTIGIDGIEFVFQYEQYTVEEVYVYQMLYSGRYVLYFKADMYLVEMQQANDGTFWLHDHNELWPDEYSTFILTRDGYSDPWEMFNGAYTALNSSGDRMKIDSSGVTFTIDGQQIVAQDVKFYRSGYAVPTFKFSFNGIDYTLSQWGESMGYLQLSAAFTRSVLFAKDGYKPDWSVYKGAWYGEGSDGSRYDLDLTGNEFKFYINGVLQDVYGLSFDQIYFVNGGYLYQFDFFVGDTAWSFSQRYNESTGEEFVSMTVFRLKNGSATANQMCILWKDKTVELTSWPNLVGEWSAEGYTVKVTANTLTVSKSGTDMPVSNLKCYSSFDYTDSATFYQFRFTCDGHSYAVQPSRSGEYISLVILGNAGEDDRHLILPVSNYNVPDVWKGWIGYYESSATSGDKIAVNITSDGIYVSLDAGNMTLATITYYDSSEHELHVTVNNASYRINLNDWGTGELYLVFMDEYSHILYVKSTSALDWTRHVVDGDFVDRASGWALRIKNEQLFVRAGSGEFVLVDSEGIKCSYSSDSKLYSLSWALDGATYVMEINDAYKTLTLSVNAKQYTLQFDDDAVYNGIFPEEYLGTWSTTKGDYVIVVKQNSLVINGEEVKDITVEELNWGQSIYYNFTWNGISCSISFTVYNSTVQLYLTGSTPSEKWAVQETLFQAN